MAPPRPREKNESDAHARELQWVCTVVHLPRNRVHVSQALGLPEVMEEEKKYPILVEAVLSKEHLPEVLANLVSGLYKYAYVS